MTHLPRGKKIEHLVVVTSATTTEPASQGSLKINFFFKYVEVKYKKEVRSIILFTITTKIKNEEEGGGGATWWRRHEEGKRREVKEKGKKTEVCERESNNGDGQGKLW